MSDTDLHRVANSVISRSLDGASETALLEGMRAQLREVGVDVSRATAIAACGTPKAATAECASRAATSSLPPRARTRTSL